MIWIAPVLVAFFVTLAFPPFGFWPLAVFAFAYFVHPLLDPRLTRRRAVIQFAVYSFAVYSFGFYWLAYTLKEFGGLPWIASVPVTVFIFAAFAVIPAICGAIWATVQHKIPARLRPASLWLWLIVYDGLDVRLFPWSPAQSVGSDPWLMASVYRLGTWGWRALFFGLAVFLAQLAAKNPPLRQWAPRAAGAVALYALIGYGVGYRCRHELMVKYAERQPVALIQGNIGNYEKKLTKQRVMPTVVNVLAIHRDLIERTAIHETDAVQAGIEPWIAWPETSFPGYPMNSETDRVFLEDWTRLTRGLQIVGTYESTPTEFGGKTILMDYNIVALFHELKGYVAHYRKNVRLMFGEYIPGDESFPGLYKIFPAVNHFGRGYVKTALPHPDPQGAVFLPLVCYELLFEGFVSDFVSEARLKYPGRPLVLVNPTNDSWYGDTSEPFQNSFLDRWAAARVGLPLLRPTNTGLSMVVAPWGEILAQGPRDETTVIFGQLPVEKIQKRMMDEPKL